MKNFFSALVGEFRSFLSALFRSMTSNLNDEDWNDLVFLTFYLIITGGIICVFLYILSGCTLDISHFILT